MKRTLFPLLLCVVLLIFAGCAKSLKEHAETMPTGTQAAQPIQTLPTDAPTLPVQTVPAVIPTDPPPPETRPGPVVIQSSIVLRDYLRAQAEAGNTHFSFQFTSTTVDVSPQNIARVGGYFYVHTQVEGDLCHVQVLEYPGERIVKAFKSGNDADLTQAEQQAMAIALDLVDRARQISSTEPELEKNLFDLFRAHVTYNNGSTAIPDPSDPPRHLTAVGALVDGSANCQGYADGFYVLASLAGFRMERMHVDIPEGGHTVNIIYLDGAWYVVDTTFNDFADPSGVQISYTLMNVGRDKCLRYSWGEDVERYPIPQLTDHHFYYYQPGEQHRRCFDTVDAMAQRVIDDLRVYGTTEFHMMLEGRIAAWQELGDALTRISAEYGLTVSYNIWYEHNVEDTYFYIQLNGTPQ